jgi:hypothetical protein
MKSQALRDSARNQECTFNIVGVCNYDPATVVLCHLPSETRGMGMKSTDLCAAYGCSSCHDAIDGRKPSTEYEQNAGFYNMRAIIRTLTKYAECGLLVIKGAK